jgi:hypothetical protein
MDNIELESGFYSRCLRTLRRLCGRSGKLPTSCVLADDLEKVGSEARTSGGFADIWLGKFKGRTVALKVLRVYGTDNIKTVKKVRKGDVDVPAIPLLVIAALLQRSCSLETAVAPEHHPFYGCIYNTLPVVYGVRMDGKGQHCDLPQEKPNGESFVSGI